MSNKLLEAYLIRPQICPNPVFIIGSPRSGTSILAWSLAQHSHLWASAESDILYYLFGRGHLGTAFETARARPDGTWLCKEEVGKSEFYGFVGVGLNALFTSRSGGKRWIDQTPLYTLIVDLLADLFPGARLYILLGRPVVVQKVAARAVWRVLPGVPVRVRRHRTWVSACQARVESPVSPAGDSVHESAYYVRRVLSAM